MNKLTSRALKKFQDAAVGLVNLVGRSLAELPVDSAALAAVRGIADDLCC